MCTCEECIFCHCWYPALNNWILSSYFLFLLFSSLYFLWVAFSILFLISWECIYIIDFQLLIFLNIHLKAVHFLLNIALDIYLRIFMSYFFVTWFKIFSNIFLIFTMLSSLAYGYLYIYGLNFITLGILKIFSYLIVSDFYLLFIAFQISVIIVYSEWLKYFNCFWDLFWSNFGKCHLKTPNPAIVRCSVLHITKLHWIIMLLNSPTFLLICLLVYLFYWLPQERCLKVLHS